MINLPSTLGKSFIISAFVPAFLFVLLNALFIAPSGLPAISILTIPSDNPILTALGIKGVDLTMLIVPSLLAVLLNAFNTFIIRLFEGAPRFERNGIFKWLQQRRLKEHQALYGDLQAFQAELAQARDPLEQRGLRLEINKLYEQIYTGLDGNGFQLPYDEKRLMPTRFGNVWGVIEEYPYRRYGMDGTTFWPRLISVVPKEYSDMIADHKMTMDTLLNSSLLAILFGIELVVVTLRGFTFQNLILSIGAFIAAYLLYQAAISTLLEMGELINSCYDLFRSALLLKFGVTPPVGDIESERKIWSGLNSYILAGDPFYYPAFTKTEQEQK